MKKNIEVFLKKNNEEINEENYIRNLMYEDKEITDKNNIHNILDLNNKINSDENDDNNINEDDNEENINDEEEKMKLKKIIYFNNIYILIYYYK